MSAKDEIGIIMREELTALRDKIIAQHKAAGQMASGATVKSMRVEVSDYAGVLLGRSAFGVLEEGRRSGKTPHNFVNIILKWMRSKGIQASPIPYKREGKHKYTPQQRGEMSLAGAIATKIRKEGTVLHRRGGRSDIYSNAIPDTKKAILKRVLKVFDVEFANIKVNNNP